MGDGADSPSINTSVPHPARIYNVFLGGKDNFAADRQIAEQTLALFPDIPVMARQNREFLHRVVRYMVEEAGIDQFLDIGSGLPAEGNVHEIAQELDPEAKVLYIDNDPLVLVHGQALLAENGNTKVVTADLRQVDELLAAVEESGLLDLSRPVGLMLVAVLHFISDEEDVEGLLRSYLARLAPGSAMAISHISPGGADSERLDQAVDIYSAATPPGVHLRTAEQVTRLFDGTTLLPPGVVPIADWHPRPGDDTRPTAATGLGGVGLL
ncbi:SAM-dependent methyltransferase [Actinocorallia aurantiaca]|uniref:SAM-dependent methyltransferase n=1 Tax=Actinocorallia aurantiaca TaxID=46204 RepID=A0ABN3TTN7_9ACTN